MKAEIRYDFLLKLDSFLKLRGYRLIVIPDYKNLNPNMDIEVFSGQLRFSQEIAIYNISKINIGTAGGPVWSARFMRNVNMFVTNFAIEGDHIGSFSDLKTSFGKILNMECNLL